MNGLKYPDLQWPNSLREAEFKGTDTQVPFLLLLASKPKHLHVVYPPLKKAQRAVPNWFNS